MTLAEYIKGLNALIKRNPIAKDLTVIYSSDEEGNEYKRVIFSPAIAQVHDIEEERWIELVGFYGEDDIEIEDCNAVCIN